VLSEDHRKLESIFDFVQGITALARTKTHQDAPPRIGGQGQETVGARRLTQTSRAAIDAARLTVCLVFQHHCIVIFADPQFADRRRPPRSRSPPLRAAREVTQIMLKV